MKHLQLLSEYKGVNPLVVTSGGIAKNDVYDEDITVEWVGNLPRTLNQQSFLSSSFQTVIIWSSGTTA